MTTITELETKLAALAAELETLKSQPAPAPLRYKVGDIVLIPVRVVDVDDHDKKVSYKVQGFGGRIGTASGQWADRTVLEPAQAESEDE